MDPSTIVGWLKILINGLWRVRLDARIEASELKVTVTNASSRVLTVQDIVVGYGADKHGIRDLVTISEPRVFLNVDGTYFAPPLPVSRMREAVQTLQLKQIAKGALWVRVGIAGCSARYTPVLLPAEIVEKALNNDEKWDKARIVIAELVLGFRPVPEGHRI